MVLENNEGDVKVEVNCYDSRIFQNKNNFYICHLILKQTRTDKTYKVKLKKVYQIVVISHLVFPKTHQEIHPFLEIVDINLAKITKTSYTSIRGKNP